jgi:hypothetical protein
MRWTPLSFYSIATRTFAHSAQKVGKWRNGIRAGLNKQETIAEANNYLRCNR